MTELDKLIEAVEAGTLTGESELSYPFGMAEMIDAALGRCDIWDGVAVAHDGSLDTAKEIHDALLPGWRFITIRNRLGADGYEVRMQDQPMARQGAIRVCAEGPSMARTWLLAILRAYRATKENADG